MRRVSRNPRAKVVAVLEEVRRLLRKPKYWTKRTPARDAKGKPVTPTSNKACQFCLLGAIDLALDDLIGRDMPPRYFSVFFEVHKVLKQTLCRMYPDDTPEIDVFNDNEKTTHKDVLRLIDETLESLET